MNDDPEREAGTRRAPGSASAPLSPRDRAERARRQDRRLDEGLEETFPASDPVSIVVD